MDTSVLDKVLVALEEKYPLTLSVTEYVVDRLGVEDPREYGKYAAFIVDKELGVRQGQTGSFIRITDKGREVVKAGGYDKYLELLDRQEKEKADNDLIASRKLRHDATISEWQVKTKWWPLIISALSLIISLIALIRPMLTEEVTGRTTVSKPEEVEVSSNSSDMTKEAVQYSNSDTLK